MTEIIIEWLELEKCSKTELTTQLVLHFELARSKRSRVGNVSTPTCRFIMTMLEKEKNWTFEEILSLFEKVRPWISPAHTKSFKKFRDIAIDMCATTSELKRTLQFVPMRDVSFDRVVSIAKDKEELADLVREYFLK